MTSSGIPMRPRTAKNAAKPGTAKKKAQQQRAQTANPGWRRRLRYPLVKDAHQTKDYVEMQGKKADDVLGSVEEFAKPDYGVDVFKLESPVNAADADGSASVQAVFDEMGRLAGRWNYAATRENFCRR